MDYLKTSTNLSGLRQCKNLMRFAAVLAFAATPALLQAQISLATLVDLAGKNSGTVKLAQEVSLGTYYIYVYKTSSPSEAPISSVSRKP